MEKRKNKKSFLELPHQVRYYTDIYVYLSV